MKMEVKRKIHKFYQINEDTAIEYKIKYVVRLAFGVWGNKKLALVDESKQKKNIVCTLYSVQVHSLKFHDNLKLVDIRHAK